MSPGAITAIILSVIVFFSAAGALFYYRYLKDRPQEEPPGTEASTEPTATQTQPPATTRPPDDPEDPEDPEPGLSVFEEALLALDPYEAQHLGANPVYYYPHPDLDLAIDLRGQEQAARMMFVYPTPKGFLVTSRQAIIYEFLSLRDYRAGIEWSGITTSVELVTEDEAQAIEAERWASQEPDAENYLMLPHQGQFLYIYDTVSGGPDPAWFAAELYGSSVFFDRNYLEKRLTARIPGIEIEETPFDAGKEAAALLQLLEENPAKFEWRYLMPPYQEDPDAVTKPNWEILEALIEEPLYDFLSIDLDGDGRPEHIVHCSCLTYDAFGLDGYWAVFTETRGGLRLIGFSATGTSTLLYGNEEFAYLDFGFYGYPGEVHLLLDSHPIPVPREEDRTFRYVTYTSISQIMDLEDEGEDLNPYRMQTLVPKAIPDDDGGYSIEFYLLDPEAFEDFLDLLSPLAGEGLAFKGIPLEGPVRISRIRDYLDGEYPFLPLTEDDWKNAIIFEDVLSQGPPVEYVKIMSLLPHPELIWK